MEDFKKRLIAEEAELNIKLSKLLKFVNSDKFNDLDYVQRTLLDLQAGSMRTYLKCLQARIKLLP